MSRIGKQPISVPASVKIKLDSSQVEVSGPQASLSLKIPANIKVELRQNQLLVRPANSSRQARANHGTIRSHLNNMVQGVVTPYTKQLEIRGTGYKANLSGNKLVLSLGFIHPVEIVAPPGIKFQVDNDTKITVSGADKNLVGQIASNIRKIKPPEPYQGKGIRYQGEFIKLKPGKAAKAEAQT